MVERIDHLARYGLRDLSPLEPTTDAPEFSSEQLEYLQKVFGAGPQLVMVLGATEMETMIKLAGRAQGYADMLSHISTLVKANS